MYGCESWTVKKAEHRRIDAFELWCWRRLLRVPWTARRSHQSILNDAKAETPVLWPRHAELTHWKRLWCWEGLEAGGKGDDRGWNGWMASPTWWTWVWVNSGSWWYHPAISSSVVPFFSCPQSLPASGTFQMSQLFTSGAPIIGVSASTSVLSMHTQDWSPLGWTGWISLQSKGLSRVFSNTNTTVQMHQFFGAQLSW